MKTENTQNKLYIYNTLSRSKELFEPLNPPFAGMYVCGPTVYGLPHLGHARGVITYDLVFRYLKYLGYKVRYVRNITDVGHLENDADEGEDRIAKKARLEQLEPMEVVEYYSNRFSEAWEMLNIQKPSIEPRASGHIIEQQLMVEKIIENGFAYENNGSVYFDIKKYNNHYKNYGKLSGRVIDDLLSYTRELDGQSQKRESFDFALWKKAEPEHIMRWPSKWSDGFPGWHLECSVMSTKYLGEKFDIHGGGMDLLFPHHECEIAQSVAANGEEAVKYWMHNNMITINGQKMGKSLGNFITLEEMFSGEHDLLEQAYTPMTIRFFMYQAHYRSPLDFSNEALKAAEKGLYRLFTGIEVLDNLTASDAPGNNEIKQLNDKCFAALNDDFNTPVLVAHLFDGVRMINSAKAGNITINTHDLELLKNLYNNIVFNILGLKEENKSSESSSLLYNVVEMILNIRKEAKQNKDFATSDKIRNELTKLRITVKDTKDGCEWEIK